MSVPEELVWLIAQLRGTASRRERIRLLARGWRTVQDLSPADRIAVAHELGFDGAESLVEQLSRRGGASPAAVLEMLERAEDAGPEQIVTMVQDLADPEGRRSLGTRFLNAAKHWVADLESWEDTTGEPVNGDEEPVVVPPDGFRETETVDLDVPVPPRPPLAPMPEPGPNGPSADVEPAERAERLSGGDVIDDMPESEPDPVVDGDAAADADDETEAHGPGRRDVDRPHETAAPGPDPEPIAEPPEESPHTRYTVSVVAPATVLDDVVRRLVGCPSVLRRLKELAGLARELAVADPDDFSSLLDLFPDGWARRRALEAMFRAGAPRDLDTALSLTATLSDAAQRGWALSTLVHTRDLDSDGVDAALSLASSPVLRRRLERLGAETSEVVVEG